MNGADEQYSLQREGMAGESVQSEVDEGVPGESAQSELDESVQVQTGRG